MNRTTWIVATIAIVLVIAAFLGIYYITSDYMFGVLKSDHFTGLDLSLDSFIDLDVTQITPNLYVGAFPQVKQYVDQFTHIVNISGIAYDPPVNPETGESPEILTLDKVADVLTVDIKQYFNLTNSFIDDAIKNNPDAAVYVHCWRGISRSVTIVAAYLMHSKQISADRALGLIM